MDKKALGIAILIIVIFSLLTSCARPSTAAALPGETIQSVTQTPELMEGPYALHSDKALIDELMAYYHLVDLYAYGTFDDGIETCRTYVAVLDELLKRETAPWAFKTYGVELLKSYIQAASEDQKLNVQFEVNTLVDLINYFCDDFYVKTTYKWRSNTYELYVGDVSAENIPR